MRLIKLNVTWFVVLLASACGNPKRSAQTDSHSMTAGTEEPDLVAARAYIQMCNENLTNNTFQNTSDLINCYCKYSSGVDVDENIERDFEEKIYACPNKSGWGTQVVLPPPTAPHVPFQNPTLPTQNNE